MISHPATYILTRIVIKTKVDVRVWAPNQDYRKPVERQTKHLMISDVHMTSKYKNGKEGAFKWWVGMGDETKQKT